MEEWKEYKLGEVAQIKGGKLLPKGVKLIASLNGHPYKRVRDLGTKKTIELDSSFEYVDEETQKSISRLTGNCVKIVNLNTLNREYLYYYLISKDGQDEIRKWYCRCRSSKITHQKHAKYNS